jgi:anti-anti-sigma regulatory factor
MVAFSLGAYLGLGGAHAQGHLQPKTTPEIAPAEWFLDVIVNLVGIAFLLWFFVNQFQHALAQSRTYATELEAYKASLEEQVATRTAELEESYKEQEHLHRQVLDAQQQIIHELSTPVIPIMDAPDGAGGIIVMPLVGSIDSVRAKDIMRALLAGIRTHRARVVILDITGVPSVDSGVANHLNKTIQAAQLKGTRTIITGISDAVAEAVVDLGVDWSGVETLGDLQTGLVAALAKIGRRITE